MQKRPAETRQTHAQTVRKGTVGHQGADQRHSHLTAVRVAAHREVVSEGGQFGSGVWRMHHSESERVRFLPDGYPQVVPLDVGIVQPYDLE